MSDELPKFRHVAYPKVFSLMSKVLSSGGKSHLVRIQQFEDGHYRAIFKAEYFAGAEGTPSDPSKSQWSTLKKRLKRHDRSAFIFKRYGKTPDRQYYYIDFGFFLE